MVSRFFEVTRYGRVTLPKNFLSSDRGRVALPNTRGTRFRDFFGIALSIAICNAFGIAFFTVSRYYSIIFSRINHKLTSK